MMLTILAGAGQETVSLEAYLSHSPRLTNGDRFALS